MILFVRISSPTYLLRFCSTFSLCYAIFSRFPLVSAGVVNVAVFCLTGTMKERGSCIVKSTTGAVMEDTATVARRPLQQDS